MTIIFVVLFVGCQGGTETAVSPTAAPAETVITEAATDPPPTQTAETVADTPTAVLEEEAVVVEEETAVPPTEPVPADTNSIRDLTILYTNDEHGWMLGTEEGSGAANLLGLWEEIEGYQQNEHTILLSGGDMWTGPAISSWFDGESMAQVMNQMGYTAAAIGNHEFDFGLDVLQLRAAESTFPFVSANIRRKSDGTIPTDVGIQPYALTTVNEVVVGIVGLTTITTPTTTNPVNVSEFDFIDYETALREIVPEVRAAGAELILVPGHICQGEVEFLAQNVSDLGIHLLGGGHCNELFASESNGIILLEGGANMQSYAWAQLQFDTETDTIVNADYGVAQNMQGMANADLAMLIENWETAASAELDVVIGHTDGIERRSQEMQDLITQAWLARFPASDVAVTNLGGMRAPFEPGEITLGDIITVMPFNNVIIDVKMTGEQLRQFIQIADNDAVAGIGRVNGALTMLKTGEPLDREATYSVLVNDFMYAGGDNYSVLAVFDPNAYNTAVDWRQPVIDWITTQESSAEQPIDLALEAFGNQ
ncbi:MAG: bifunctional UDP-sugar hydrolase/5'-nucleotidase [Chloroflexota bacterium]